MGSSMNLSWGGHSNGRIPASAMVTVRSEGFEAQAGRQVIALGAAFLRRFGKPLIISDGYRDYGEQVTNWNNWVRFRNGGPWAPQAAYYGTSNHGWGKAADFGSGVQTFGTAEKRWMDKHAPAYGWHPTGNGFTQPEAWHYDYTGNPTITAGDGHTIIEEEGDDDMLKPKLIKRTEGNAEWSLCAPWLKGTDSKQAGYLVTTDAAKAKAWARLYDRGFSNETEGNRADYMAMQEAAREIRTQWLNSTPTVELGEVAGPTAFTFTGTATPA